MSIDTLPLGSRVVANCVAAMVPTAADVSATVLDRKPWTLIETGQPAVKRAGSRLVTVTRSVSPSHAASAAARVTEPGMLASTPSTSESATWRLRAGAGTGAAAGADAGPWDGWVNGVGTDLEWAPTPTKGTSPNAPIAPATHTA